MAVDIQNTVKLIDQYTGELVGYSPVTTWWDNTPMDDSKVDNVLYRKQGSTYYKRNFTGPVNVKWFGAKGDGVTDDTAAIQSSFKYKNVLIPNGTYLVNKLILEDNQVITGEVDTILKLNSGVTSAGSGDLAVSLICIVDVENIKISNFSIDGNRSAQSPISDGEYYGIVLYSAKKVSISKISIKDCATDGFFVRSNILVPGHSSDYTESEDLVVDNVTITNSRRNNLSIIGGHRLTFINSQFNSAKGVAPQAGIDIEPNGSYDDVDGVTFINCGANNNIQSGFSIYGQPGSTIKNINVVNCYAYGNPVAGIAFSGQNTATISKVNVQNFFTDKSISVYASNANKVLYKDLNVNGGVSNSLAVNSVEIGSNVNIQNINIKTTDSNAITLGLPSNTIYGSSFSFSNINTQVGSGFSNFLVYSVDQLNISNITTNGGSFGIRDLSATTPANAKLIVANALLQNHASYGIVSDAQILADNVKAVNVLGNVIRTLKKPTITSLFLENSIGVAYNNVSYTPNPKVLYKTSIPPSADFSDGDIVINTAPTPQGNYGWVRVSGNFLPFGLIGADVGKLVYGTTANRPTVTSVGFQYFDTTLGKPIYFKSTGVWVDSTGTTV